MNNDDKWRWWDYRCIKPFDGFICQGTEREANLFLNTHSSTFLAVGESRLCGAIRARSDRDKFFAFDPFRTPNFFRSRVAALLRMSVAGLALIVRTA
jgi:hypothetical protein